MKVEVVNVFNIKLTQEYIDSSITFVLRKSSLATNILFKALNESIAEIPKDHDLLVATGTGEIKNKIIYADNFKHQDKVISPTLFSKTLESNIAGQLGVLLKSNYVNFYFNEAASIEMALMNSFFRIKKHKNSIFILSYDYLDFDGIPEYPFIKNSPYQFSFGLNVIEIKQLETKKECIKIERFNYNYIHGLNLNKIISFLKSENIFNAFFDNVLIANNKFTSLNKVLESLQISYNTIEEYKNKCGEYPTSISYAIATAFNKIKSKKYRKILVLSILNNNISYIVMKS